jgi:hypothetical protein
MMEAAPVDGPDNTFTSEVSEDGSTWTSTTSLAPHGEYDPEKQLTPEQIIALKESMRSSYTLLPEVCTHIVMKMLLEKEEEVQAQKAEVEASGGSLISNTLYETREDFAQHVGVLSAAWAQSLQIAISLPGSEWPEGMSPPATYAAAIEEMQQAEKDRVMANDVAEWLTRVHGLTVRDDADGIEVSLNLEEQEEGAVFTMLHMVEESPTAPGQLSLSEFGDMVINAHQNSQAHRLTEL